MSLDLFTLARKADLSHNVRAVLESLCDACGEDDGTKCYPSISSVAYKSCLSVSQTRRIMRVLEAAGYIEAVAYLNGGRGRATEYRIHIERVPMRPPWKEVKRRLLESGELEPGEDLTDVHKVMRRMKRKKQEIEEA